MTLHMTFVDYEKPFDSIEHWAMTNDTQKVHKEIHKNSDASVRAHETTHLRWSEIVTLQLFSLALEGILKQVNWSYRGITANGEKITLWRCADDIALFSENPLALKLMLTYLEEK